MVNRIFVKTPDIIDVIMDIYYKGLGSKEEKDKIKMAMITLVLKNFNKFLHDPTGCDAFTEEEVSELMTLLYADFNSDWTKIIEHFSTLSGTSDLEDIVNKLLDTLNYLIQTEPILVEVITSKTNWVVKKILGYGFIVEYEHQIS